MLYSAERVCGGMFEASLSIEEKSRLTQRIYGFYPGYKSVGDALYPWEEIWFEARMPRPPARVLVGACGTGREAIALVERGYRVEAFEPALEFIAESRRRLRGRAHLTQMSYEQLSAVVLDGVQGIGDGLHAARYDAVVLGCGSLTHVLDVREQLRLLQALDLLCPSGPILASFFCRHEAARSPSSPGRASQLGRRIGRAVARLRRIPPAEHDRLSYRAHSGFAYSFTRREIEALARSVGREVAWGEREMQPPYYATFLPPSAGP